jgi:uracil-DNA glycosylase
MAASINLEESWKETLSAEFSKPYFLNLVDFAKSAYKTEVVYPPGKQIFRAFDLTPIAQVKVVIIGQDPYHNPGQANGLCFSVNEGIALPPSLINIFKEIERDLGIPIPANGNLERWASQGVLLLNATLTVKAHSAGSHQNKGWEQFTDAAISALNELRKNIVYMLWGSYAQRKGACIDHSGNLVLQSPHPSPLSAYRGFIGNGHFGKANAYLCEHGITPVKW